MPLSGPITAQKELAVKHLIKNQTLLIGKVFPTLCIMVTCIVLECSSNLLHMPGIDKTMGKAGVGHSLGTGLVIAKEFNVRIYGGNKLEVLIMGRARIKGTGKRFCTSVWDLKLKLKFCKKV